MEGSKRRVGARMKVDEVKDGMKVLNDENGGGGGEKAYSSRRLKKNQTSGVSEKRKVCKTEPPVVGVIEKNPIQIRKTKSDNHRQNSDGIEKKPIKLRKSRSDTCSREVSVGKEKVKKSLSELSNVGEIKSEKAVEIVVEDDDGVDGDKEDDDEEEEEEEDEVDVEEEEEEERSFDDKEINIVLPPPPPPVEEPKKLIDEEKMVDQIHQTPPTPPPPPPLPIHKKPTPMASNVHKEPPIYKRRIPVSSNAIKEAPIHKKTTPKSSNVNKEPPQVTYHPVVEPVIEQEYIRVPSISEEFQRCPQVPQSKLQNIMDLVMWRDVSKSAFVFGLGTFVLLSSSFTKDLNFSVISAISYMGLVYLAAIFVYRTILCRGAIDVEELNDQTCLVGEEEAIWFIEVILPYLNEFLLKIRSLFSGDPATTMKLAALLFVLAQCGSSITIWKLVKLGFFGVFTVPKVCSSYSTQLNGYGKFWIRRFRDAWNSCSHKKAVGAATFTLIWNLSSITARFWAAFMLLVAFKYYQQRMLREQWEEEEAMAKEKKG